MKIRVVPQLNGNFYIGDVDDEDAPLLEVRFCNESKKWDDSAKLRFSRAVFTEFVKAWNSAGSVVTGESYEGKL